MSTFPYRDRQVVNVLRTWISSPSSETTRTFPLRLCVLDCGNSACAVRFCSRLTRSFTTNASSADRQPDVSRKSVSVRVDLGGSRTHQKRNTHNRYTNKTK